MVLADAEAETEAEAEAEAEAEPALAREETAVLFPADAVALPMDSVAFPLAEANPEAVRFEKNAFFFVSEPSQQYLSKQVSHSAGQVALLASCLRLITAQATHPWNSLS